MKKQVKRAFKIVGVSLATLIVAVIAVIAIVLNFVFTPEKLTPVVLKVANESLDAKLDMGSVELTFFSTFPRFGLKLTDGTLVSKAIRDTLWQRTDTLVKFKRAVLVVNPIDYLQQQKISLYRLSLDSANVYAYKSEAGKANWEIVATDTTAVADTTSGEMPAVNEIDIRRVSLRHTTVTLDDRETRLFANLWDTDFHLKANMRQEGAMLALEVKNKNILFWQDGELLANRIALHLKTDLELDRTTRMLSLRDAQVNVNGVQLDMKGTLQRDTLAKALAVDLQYGLHAPSLETVLHMVPKSILKQADVAAQGEVLVSGTVKGLYGKERIPLATLDIQIKNASAQYAGMPYGVDELEADFYGQVDLSRQQPSYVDLKIFHLKGAHTDVLAEAKVEDLLRDPDITFHTQSVVDLTALAQTFPLQEGIHIGGKLDADLKLHCRLSTLKKQDLGRIQAGGKIRMEGLTLQDSVRNFVFTSNASLAFVGNEWLAARAEIQDMNLQAPRLNASMERLTATVKTTNPQDTTRIANMECKLDMNRLKGALGDSLQVFCGKTSATVRLQPGDRDPAKPKIGLSMEADTLFCRMDSIRMGMDKAGIAVSAEKMRDSLWIPKGIVGFNRLMVRMPQCALPIRMEKTSLTVGNRAITLRNATMRIGRSDLTASGAVHDLYGAMKFHKTLRAKLELSSNNLNCNQLIRSLSFPTDTVAAEAAATDTTSTNMRLFVIPDNVDFELQTNLRRVRYGKLLFENVRGAVDVRNQAVHLQELSMTGLGATMRTTVIYHAARPERGYAGFDFKLQNINIARLVDFSPSLDTIVPMLRSFEGTVDFNVAAETVLDSCLNIEIPTLRSAIQLRGDSLVLMDGETFAEISKKFFFKNKERNLIDSISVNITVQDGNVTVYPFEIAMDRYRAAVGGTQDLNMNFDYHISILKSPIPFKLGLNISGNLDDMKFRMGKAKYKDAVTPVAIRRVDSTVVNLGDQIVRDFKRAFRTGQMER